MGKVSISEPIKGESLTATKLNSTIASWTTESTNINAENVHDQALDNYNFAEDSVRSINASPRNGNHLLRVESQVFPQIFDKFIYKSDASLDFTNHDHILRASFHINIYPNFNTVSFTEGESFEVTLSVSASVGLGSRLIPITTRKLKYDGNQCVRSLIDESITIATHLNNVSVLTVTGTVNNLQLFLNAEFKFTNSLKTGKDIRMGVYGHFVEIETIKR
tara:strand:- start:1991 stop:2650 length:660 start_codon:yes stop_codon:yes gene_type:complete